MVLSSIVWIYPQLIGAHGLDWNFPTCAGLLAAQPAENLLPARRGFVLAEVNEAIARLRSEYQARPKSLRPAPVRPDIDVTTADKVVFDKYHSDMKRYLRRINALTETELDFYGIENRVKLLDNLAGLIGRDQLEVRVEAFQLVGAASIQAFYKSVEAGACEPEFDPVLRRLRERSDSLPSRWIESTEIGLRRRVAKWRRRTDFKCEILYPIPGLTDIEKRLNGYWTGTSPLHRAFVHESLLNVSRGFRDAFVSAPDLANLGWNGRDDQSDFLAARRSEIFEEHVSYALRFVGLRGDVYARAMGQASRRKEMGHAGYVISFDFIPGWQNGGGTREPLLTVIVRADSGQGRSYRPPRREAVVTEAQPLPWGLGDAIGVR